LRAEAVSRGVDPENLHDIFTVVRPEYEKARPEPEATLAQVADHVEHVREAEFFAEGNS
jgi:hypothetical protein